MCIKKKQQPGDNRKGTAGTKGTEKKRGEEGGKGSTKKRKKWREGGKK